MITLILFDPNSFSLFLFMYYAVLLFMEKEHELVVVLVSLISYHVSPVLAKHQKDEPILVGVLL